jgi:DNA-binding NarL/FixJ family response regulator
MHDVQQSWSSVVTVVIGEASQLNCELVASAFRPKRAHVSVVASAIGALQTLAVLKEHEPDVAIISAQLETGPLDGYHLLRELHALQSKTRAILLLDSRERDLVIDAFKCGARGVVFRDEPLETLAKCIHAVHRGQVWANSQHLGYLLDVLSQMPVRLHDAHGVELLSKREGEVVRLVSEGLTNRGISVQLGLSEHTVRNYLFRIFDKLGVSTRVELVLYCIQDKQNQSLNARMDERTEKNGNNGS